MATGCGDRLFFCGRVRRRNRISAGPHLYRPCHRKSGASGGFATASALAGDQPPHHRHRRISACDRCGLSHRPPRHPAFVLGSVSGTGSIDRRGLSAVCSRSSKPSPTACSGALYCARAAEWCDHFGGWSQPSCNVSVRRRDFADQAFLMESGRTRQEVCETGNRCACQPERRHSAQRGPELFGRCVLREFADRQTRFPKPAHSAASAGGGGYLLYSPQKRIIP